MQSGPRMSISLSMNAEAEQWIRALCLEPLPGEGGFFARTWTSPVTLPGGRPTGSSILFLITDTDFSALHRLRIDEVWHYHAGDPAELCLLDPKTQACRILTLGPDVLAGHRVQGVAPAGVWQGARIAPGLRRGWTLFGCVTSPGWVDGEWDLGERAALEASFPSHRSMVRALTR